MEGSTRKPNPYLVDLTCLYVRLKMESFRTSDLLWLENRVAFQVAWFLKNVTTEMFVTCNDAWVP